MDFEYLVNNELRKISLEKKEGSFVISDGDTVVKADIQSISANVISVMIEDHSYLIYIARDQDKKYVFVEGQQFVIQEPGRETKGFHGGEDKTQEGTLLVTAPMPGKVIQIHVTENQEVRKNQTLAIVEAMKMENEIKSSVEGFVKKIFVSAGDLVDSEKPLIELEAKKATTTSSA
jgi:biotin carboxyl carrier protein